MMARRKEERGGEKATSLVVELGKISQLTSHKQSLPGRSARIASAWLLQVRMTEEYRRQLALCCIRVL